MLTVVVVVVVVVFVPAGVLSVGKAAEALAPTRWGEGRDGCTTVAVDDILGERGVDDAEAATAAAAGADGGGGGSTLGRPRTPTPAPASPTAEGVTKTAAVDGGSREDALGGSDARPLISSWASSSPPPVAADAARLFVAGVGVCPAAV